MEVNQNNLKDIIEVFQETDIEMVNKYLNLGWTLLSLHTTDYGHPVERHQNTVFTLGWNKINGDSQKPKGKYDDIANKFV